MKQHETRKSIAARFARRPFLRKIISAMACVALAGTLASPLAHANHLQAPNLVQLLERDGRFTTLLTALDVAGLKSAPQGASPLTLFAPTDDAFVALPPGTVDALVQDIPTLQKVLLYHVLGSRASSVQLLYSGQASTLEGNIVTAKLRWPSVLINDSGVINPDVNTPNGVIHTINKVLLPPDMSMKTVGEVLAEDGRFTTLLAALQATGLDTALAEAGPFTIFAPTDKAFARLPAGTVQLLLANPDALKNILLYHVASGDLNTAELAAQRNVSTLQGASSRIYSAFGRTYVNNAFIQTGNIDASNGIVHAISRVLLPPTH